MDIDLPRVSTFLLAWNPKHWHWKELELTVQEVATGVPVIDRWSCGNSKQLKRSDRIFLIRLGEHPKGIMASGTITEGSYEDLHWDDVKANEGKLTRYVEFRYDVLLNP